MIQAIFSASKKSFIDKSHLLVVRDAQIYFLCKFDQLSLPKTIEFFLHSFERCSRDS